MSRYAVLLVGIMLAALTGCDTTQSQQADGVNVSGEPGQGSWPVKGFNEGAIVCRGLPGRPLAEPPYFVFFEAPTGELYALNGKAMGEVGRGSIQAKVLRDEMDDPSVGAYLLLGDWIQVGIALCKGDRAEAERLAAEADRRAAE